MIINKNKYFKEMLEGFLDDFKTDKNTHITGESLCLLSNFIFDDFDFTSFHYKELIYSLFFELECVMEYNSPINPIENFENKRVLYYMLLGIINKLKIIENSNNIKNYINSLSSVDKNAIFSILTFIFAHQGIIDDELIENFSNFTSSLINNNNVKLLIRSNKLGNHYFYYTSDYVERLYPEILSLKK